MPETAAGGDSRIVLDEFWNALLDRRRDLPGLLRAIAERVVAVLGDGCVLTTVTDDGLELRPEAIAHADDTVAAAMREVLGRANVRIGEGIAGRVAADRRAVLLNDLPPEVVDETEPWRLHERSCRRLSSMAATAVDLGIDLGSIAEICRRYQVVRLDVFGSAGRGELTTDSDLDLLYDLDPGARLGWAIEDLNAELAEAMGRPVDLVARRYINPRIRDQVLAEAIPLYEA